MIELFIQGKKADIKESEEVRITYEALTVDTPTAVKNSYSKSINLEGTPTNNAIFNNVWKLDYNIEDSNFDPRKRVPFELYNNSDIIDAGYIQLNSISINNGKINYNINLYGELGNFFYNLQYNEDGKALTLADVYFRFQKEDGTTYTENEERTESIMIWDAQTINEGWDKLKLNDFNDRQPSTFIKAAPTYSGFYENFDSNKFLVNYATLTDEEKQLFPEVQGNYGGYLLAETQREYDEWEARDLRSINQRPAIKFDFLIDSILNNSKNNWNVNIDEDIRNSEYFNKSWVILNRLDFEKSTQNGLNKMTLTSDEGTDPHHTDSIANHFRLTPDINTDDAETPKLNIDFNVAISKAEGSFEQELATTAAVENKTQNRFIYGGYLINVTLTDDDNNVVYKSPQYYLTSYVNNHTGWIMDNTDVRYGLGTKFGGVTINSRNAKEIFDYLINKKYGINPNELIVVYEHMSSNDDGEFTFDNALNITTELPKDKVITVKIDVMRICMANKESYNTMLNFATGPYMESYTNSGKNWWIIGDNIFNNYSVSDNTGWYDGDINPNIMLTEVNKDVIFGNSDTPYDYLISFTKMFNYKFLVDIPTKSINIVPRNKYYYDKVIDIDDKIDRTTIDIKPTTIENRYYKYGLKTPETYAELLYAKKNKTEYGNYIYTTPFNFNSNTKNLFDGNIYSNVIPYRLNSNMFSYIRMSEDSPVYYPTFAIPYTYSYNYGSEDYKHNGAMASMEIPKYYDSIQKLCCFDKDNSNVDDIKQTIVFQDGFKSYPLPITISDNVPQMMSMNENPCYLYDREAQYQRTDIPIFTKYLTDVETGRYTHSFDFVKPEYTFIGDDSKYGQECAVVGTYWMNFLNDIYAKNNRSVTLKCRLTRKPSEAMRYFYHFDNSIWTLSKVADYTPEDYFCKCTFVKIDNKNNYI